MKVKVVVGCYGNLFASQPYQICRFDVNVRREGKNRAKKRDKAAYCRQSGSILGHSSSICDEDRGWKSQQAATNRRFLLLSYQTCYFKATGTDAGLQRRLVTKLSSCLVGSGSALTGRLNEGER